MSKKNLRNKKILMTVYLGLDSEGGFQLRVDNVNNLFVFFFVTWGGGRIVGDFQKKPIYVISESVHSAQRRSLHHSIYIY